VIKGRIGSTRMLLRGWRIETAPALTDSTVRRAVAQLLSELTAQLGFTWIVGIDRGGRVLAHDLAVTRPSQCDVAVASNTKSLGKRMTLAHDRPVPRGSRALVVDDTVNSGLTARSTIRAVEAVGAEAVGLACLVRYSELRPPMLRGWRGPVLGVFSLSDLSLRRFSVAAFPNYQHGASGRRNGR
jgi:adenine/guanine phosphoribosyltransferase-like PRPP-binding protein